VADLVSGVRAALVGCGRIAPAHVVALRHAGCEVVAVAATLGSPRVDAFATEHGIPKVHRDVEALAGDDGWDVAVVAGAVERTVDDARVLAPVGRPLLVEKPVALEPDALAELEPWADQILVGYNRRHYAPVIRARQHLAERGPALVELALPERIPGSPDDAFRERQWVVNSTHGLDLARHLLGDLEVVATSPVGTEEPVPGFGAILRSRRGDVVQLTADWNAPDNFRLACSWTDFRFELRPFEVGTGYHGTTVVEPTAEHPVRRYQPRVVEEVVAVASGGAKPGFVEQANELVELARGMEPVRSARLVDALAAVVLARDLLERASA